MFFLTMLVYLFWGWCLLWVFFLLFIPQFLEWCKFKLGCWYWSWKFKRMYRKWGV